MTIRHRGNRWAVIHCHGEDKGKTIATHKTKKEALAQHRAIQANKRRKSHLSPSGQRLRKRLTGK